jgi:hypothetical protein
MKHYDHICYDMSGSISLLPCMNHQKDPPNFIPDYSYTFVTNLISKGWSSLKVCFLIFTVTDSKIVIYDSKCI